MKVSDVMHKQVDYVSPNVSIKGVARIIFGRNVNGIPVCKGRKVIGFITERDILDQFYPSVQEYIEDYAHARDFEAMEEKIKELFTLSAEKIMNKDVITVTADTPLLRAQSLMKTKSIGRLPVVDGKGNLIGIISNGDIFRAVVGQKLPMEQDEEFHDWLSRRYDVIIDWKERLAAEIPDLIKLFRREHRQYILDVGCGTGMHAIDLAEHGFNVIGIDRSFRMIEVANKKANDLPVSVRKRIKFIKTEYKNLDTVLGETFDAVIFMGAGLAHIINPQAALQEINKVLHKHTILIAQIANFDKILVDRKRFYDFNIRKSPYEEEKEQVFLRFYDPVEKGYLTLNVGVFTKGTKRWMFQGMHAMSIFPLDTKKVTTFLKKIHFTNISFYGGEKGFFYDSLFSKPFNQQVSDVMVVVARR